jgi:hypothetical protein
MGNALATFKAQQEAVEALHARLRDVAAVVADLTTRVDGLRLGGELTATLEAEERWLAKTQEVLRDVHRWRERESRELRRSALWRWSTAVAFALAVSTATGAGFLWARQLYAAELERLQSQAALADLIERRVAAMTAIERQQFERLMKVSAATPQR